ncbi:MAG: insulinase family protein [Sandaracinaceae bacterium]|nr:insulinase family protein [Sandaracinaceae bacterium]
MPSQSRATHAGTVPFGDRLRIERYLLDNGLELLVLPDPSAAIVSYHSWFRVGSRDEARGKTGQAHLLEHLMFIATERFAEGEFDRLVEQAGGESNAATWVDWTYYYENLPASELPLAIDLEAERMSRLVLAAPRVKSEKSVVLSERRDRVEDDIDGAVSEALYAAAFGRGHPYGWPTIGWERDIRGFTARDCVGFYRKHYAPDRATLVVAGDIDPRAVARRVARAYGPIPASGAARPLVPAPARPSQRSRTLRLRTPTEKVALAWRAPRFADPDHAAAVILGQILSGGRSARLYRELVQSTELATEVRASVAPFEHHALFDLWISAREGVRIDRALRLAERAIARLVGELVSAEELDKVKNRLELGFLAALETIPGKAEQIGFSRLVAGDPAHAFRRLEEYRRVSPADLQRVAAAIFGGPRVTIRVEPRVTRSSHRGAA